MSTQSLQKLGSTLIARDRVLAVRPITGTRCNALEVTFDNGQTLSITDSDPMAALQSFVVDGPTAPHLTEDRSVGAMNSTLLADT